MKALVLFAIIAALGAPFEAQCEPSKRTLENCNRIKESTRRLECLKAAVAAKPAPEPEQAKPQPDTARLSVSGAASICERVFTGLATKHDLASELTEKSTDADLAVTWPPNEGKSPMICVVSRSTRTIQRIESNGKVMSQGMLRDVERDAGFRADFKAGNYENFVRFAKAAATQSFKDPSSAQYRVLFISGNVLPVLCGEVNGKNSYGAYVGFRRFYASGQEMLNAVETEREAMVFEKMWPSMCGEKIVDISAQ
jgi:hypothetical protein